MVCPKCGGKTKVNKTIQIKDDNEVYRNRKCLACGHSFYTTEFEVDFEGIYKEIWDNKLKEWYMNRKDKI